MLGKRKYFAKLIPSLALVACQLFFWAATVQAGMSRCFVVSGLKNDPVRAFRNFDRFIENPEIVGKKCKIVGSWVELDQELSRHPSTPGNETFILQLAHGSSEIYSCDSKEDSPTLIENLIFKWSAQYKIGAALDSCYSGSTVANISIDPRMAAAKNIPCLLASSPIGRHSFSIIGQGGDPLLALLHAGNSISDID